MSTIQDLTEKIRGFVHERGSGWEDAHNPKDLAESVMVEGAELLEHFQFKNYTQVAEHIKTHRDEIGEECADVAIYLFELADKCDIDLTQAIERKIQKNTSKYPTK